ncbi:MAG: methyltransferase domain-containing protein [Kiritimatiellaeota bacterium]|nr:methyltransferase domain-containing protein [Kiritimatiellota bacterium]
MNHVYGPYIDSEDKLENAVRAFQVSRLVLTAVELGVFPAVGENGADAGTVTERLGTDARATAMLLNALVAIGLLAKDGAFFRCTPLSAEMLCRVAPCFVLPMLEHMGHLWESWSHLTEIVRGGSLPVRIEEPACREDQVESFIGAMHHFGLRQQGPFVQAIDWTGVRHVLDLGGGSGVYAISFCRAAPCLTATVFDRASVVRLARRYIEEAGLTARIRVLAGDMLADDIGSGYDLVWLSNVIHSMAREDVAVLFRKVAGALNPGGRFVVRDFVLEDDRTRPAPGAVFALNMLVNTPAGRCYTRSELAELLKAAGLVDPCLQTVEADTATRLMIAHKS